MEDITFYDLFLEYMDYIKIRIKPQSLRKFQSNFKLHILPFFKDYKLNDIKSRDIMKWQETIYNKHFSNSYNKNIQATLVMIFNYAIKFDYLNTNINVASKVGGFSKRNIKRKYNVWTLEEFNSFISIIDNNLYKLLFSTLFYTGMRIGECLALTWNDFHSNYFDINKTISKELNPDKSYIITSPKTSSSYREIYLDSKLISELNSLKQTEMLKEDFDNSWFIFGGSKPLSRTTIERYKNMYCDLANVKKIKLHEFRHSHATLLISNGVPITAISQRLGHADITMTLNTYSHSIPQDENKVIILLNNIKTS